MRHLSPILSSLLSSSSSSSRPFFLLLQVSQFSASSSSFPSHSQFSRRQDEESRNVKVSVWWDFENCNVPSGINVFRIAHTITAAIRANGMKGPVEITAFGDMLQLSKVKQEALSSTGINLNHIPRGGKNSADRCLLLNLMFWVSQNPPPAHLFLISGDKDFASILHRLRMSNYNILLAGPECTNGVLCSAASIAWHWHDLLRGENLTGKYFNQPPDGPYGSWYGHYKVPLLDPFSYNEQPEASSDSDDKPQPRPVSKAVILRQIHQILKSHPKGLLVAELRNELKKCDFELDKEYYGYKRFLPFLSAQQDILKVGVGGDGQFFVRGVKRKFSEAYEGNQGMSSGPDSNNEDEDVYAISNLSYDDSSVKEGADRKTSLRKSSEKLSKSSSSGQNLKDTFGKAHQPSAVDGNMTEAANATEADSTLPHRDETIAETINPPELPPGEEKIVEMANAPESDSRLPAVVEQDSMSEAGFFRNLWRKWFGSESVGFDHKSSKDKEKYGTSAGGSEKESDTASEKHFNSKDSSTKGLDVERDSKSPISFVDLDHSSLHSLSSRKSVMDSGTSTSPGFHGRIQNWCKFWKSSSDSDKQSDSSSNRQNVIITDSAKAELFSKDSFWSSMKSFIETPEGLLLVSESKTREQVACDLQRKGPACLQSLTENDILELVDLLISEKKWVEECPSEVFPFKLTEVGKGLSSDCPNGLSSIFAGASPQPNLERLPKHDGGQSGDVSHVEPSPSTRKKLPVRSRDEVLADCQTLVNEMLKEHPGGFFVGLFKKHFLERYGYHLNMQNLGFGKLTSLLRTMSGVKIESGYIVPSNNTSKVVNSESTILDNQENISHRVAPDYKLSDVSKTGDGGDSLWEELGPVASMKSSKINRGSASRTSAVKPVVEQQNFEYEPAISEDEFSDSEDTYPALGAEGRGQGGMEKDSSSLLRILDSWYSSKGGDGCKDKPENVDGVVGLASDVPKLSDSFVIGAKIETCMKGHGRRNGPQKTYSFVSDPDINDNTSKLVDGVLENLRNQSPHKSSKNGGLKAMCECER